MRSRNYGTQTLWPVLAVVLGLATWAILLLFAPVSRNWILLTVVILPPFVLAPLRPDDGWWQGVAALVASAWWLLLGSGRPLWEPCIVALLLAAYWLTSAWSAQAPLWAAHAPGYIGRRLRYLGGFLAACALALVLVLLTAAASPLPASEVWAFGGAAVLLAGLVSAVFLLDRR